MSWRSFLTENRGNSSAVRAHLEAWTRIPSHPVSSCGRLRTQWQPQRERKREGGGSGVCMCPF